MSQLTTQLIQTGAIESTLKLVGTVDISTQYLIWNAEAGPNLLKKLEEAPLILLRLMKFSEILLELA